MAYRLAIIWVGAHQIAESAMQVGDMMAFMQYAMQIVMAFLMMSMMFIFLPRAAVSGARIADVLDTEVEITDPDQPKTFPTPFRGELSSRMYLSNTLTRRMMSFMRSILLQTPERQLLSLDRPAVENRL